MELITIIIPVYNAEKYLNKCIKSITNQTYKNLEIILIDDGSTDNSSVICDKWKKKDNRIRVFHKENGGSSSARNLGIKLINGKYVGFIDADDYIEKNMIELLYNGCKNNNCNISWCNKYFENEEGKKNKQVIFNEDKILTKEEAFKATLMSDSSFCDKLFSADIIKNIKFEVGELYEDIMPLCMAINQCNKVCFVKNNLYHYIQRNGSNVHHFDMRKDYYEKNAKKFVEFVTKQYKSLRDVADSYYILVLCTLLCDIYIDKNKYKDYYKKILNELKKYKRIYKKNKYISKYKKIMCFLIMNNLTSLVIIMKKIRNIIKYK